MTTTDRSGDVAYAATFEHVTTLRVIAVTAFLLLVASLSVNLVQWRRAPQVMVVRVNETGKAEVIRYKMGDYTPREAEVVSSLNQWAIDRFRLIKTVIPVNFKANYYFLDARLARRLEITDADVVAKVQAGNIGEQDVQINGIRFRAFDTNKQLDGTVGSGECVIDMYKIYNVTGPGAREHWFLTLRYDLNPSATAQRDLAFQLANPLGLRITWFHEDRVMN